MAFSPIQFRYKAVRVVDISMSSVSLLVPVLKFHSAELTCLLAFLLPFCLFLLPPLSLAANRPAVSICPAPHFPSWRVFMFFIFSSSLSVMCCDLW